MRESTNVKRARSRTTRIHPVTPHLHAQGVTITALAATLGEPRGTVSSWFAAGRYNGAIPLHHAERIEDLYGVPLVLWGRIRGSDYNTAA